MVKVTVRYFELTCEEGFLLGEFPPSEVESVIQLVRSYGVQAYNKEGEAALEAATDTYIDSQWYINENENKFEIIVG